MPPKPSPRGNGRGSRLDRIEAALERLAARDEAFDGRIEALAARDEAFDARIEALAATQERTAANLEEFRAAVRGAIATQQEQIAENGRLLAGFQAAVAQVVREWQAYVNRLPRQ